MPKNLIEPNDLDLDFILDGAKQKIRVDSILSSATDPVSPPPVPEKSWAHLNDFTRELFVWIPAPTAAWVPATPLRGCNEAFALGSLAGGTLLNVSTPFSTVSTTLTWEAERISTAALEVHYGLQIFMTQPTTGVGRVVLTGSLSVGVNSPPSPVFDLPADGVIAFDGAVGLSADALLYGSMLMPEGAIVAINPGDTVNVELLYAVQGDGVFNGVSYSTGLNYSVVRLTDRNG